MKDQSTKKDAGKLRMELIPTSAMKSLGRVLTFGAKKYSPNSWKKVEADRYIGALLRHIVRFMDDPLGKDDESGLYHIEHVLCNAAFLNDFVQNSPERFGPNSLDDYVFFADGNPKIRIKPVKNDPIHDSYELAADRAEREELEDIFGDDDSIDDDQIYFWTDADPISLVAEMKEGSKNVAKTNDQEFAKHKD